MSEIPFSFFYSLCSVPGPKIRRFWEQAFSAPSTLWSEQIAFKENFYVIVIRVSTVASSLDLKDEGEESKKYEVEGNSSSLYYLYREAWGTRCK